MTGGRPRSEQQASKSHPDKGFLARITSATAFGQGLDGYDLGIISVVLPAITMEFGLSAVDVGLLAASTLTGIFFGAPVFGYLTDRFGRRKIFIFDLLAFVILGGLQAVVTNSGQLLALRFLLGLAIGAEYAIGQTMLAEMVPRRGRGRRLSGLQAAWYGGFLIAVVVAYVLLDLGVDWRWILATGAIPGLATLVLRQGLPESPRWLVSKGKEDEAHDIVEEHLGDDYYSDEDLDEESEDTSRFRDLFARDMWRRTAFASIFFTCLVAPYFAIFTFAPAVFAALGLTDPSQHHRFQRGGVRRRPGGNAGDREGGSASSAAHILLSHGRHTRRDRRLGRRARIGAHRLLRVLCVLQRHLGRSHRGLPRRDLSLGAARQRRRVRRRGQSNRRRWRHLPAAGGHRKVRHRPERLDRGGDLRGGTGRHSSLGTGDHRAEPDKGGECSSSRRRQHLNRLFVETRGSHPR